MKNLAVTTLGFILNFLVLLTRAKSAKDWYYDPVMYNYDAFIWLLTCLVGAALIIALIPDLSGNGIFDTRNEMRIWKFLRGFTLSCLVYCLISAILIFIPLYNYHIIRGNDVFATDHAIMLTLANYVIYWSTIILSIAALYYLAVDLKARSNLVELAINFPLFIINVSYSYVLDLHVDGETDWYPIFDYLTFNEGKLKFIRIKTNYE